MDEDGPTCRATRRDGEPCRAKAGASGYCFGHDPDLAQRHEEGRSVGGRNRATAARVGKLLQGDGEIVDVLSLLKTALVETYAGALDARGGGARLVEQCAGAHARDRDAGAADQGAGREGG